MVSPRLSLATLRHGSDPLDPRAQSEMEALDEKANGGPSIEVEEVVSVNDRE
jgi:hypothetical protein